jgi:hypothetical protein
MDKMKLFSFIIGKILRLRASRVGALRSCMGSMLVMAFPPE